jgi:spore coat polysaccharide biosynthesis protein SpsF
MNNYKTEQEHFWAGDFGEAYTDRNLSEQEIKSNIHLFEKILQSTENVNSIIEFGCNRGMNLLALEKINNSFDLHGVEINNTAAEVAMQETQANILTNSFLSDDFTPPLCDFSFTKGVLIHINPELLPIAYERLYNASKKYIFISEYYSPNPVEVTYRGHDGRLYKRDFAGDLLDKYSDLRLVDYGFTYRRDLEFPLDDQNWFLLEKK